MRRNHSVTEQASFGVATEPGRLRRMSTLGKLGVASGVIVASGLIGAQVAGALVTTTVGAEALGAAYALAGAGGDALLVGATDVAVGCALWPAFQRLRGGWARRARSA